MARTLFIAVIIILLSSVTIVLGDDFDAEVTDNGVDPKDVYKGDTVDIWTKVHNLADKNNGYQGAGTYDIRLRLKKPDGNYDGWYWDNRELTYDQEKEFRKSSYNFDQTGTYEIIGMVYDINGHENGWRDENLFDEKSVPLIIEERPYDPEATRESPTDQDIQITKGSEQTFETTVKDDNCDLYYVEWYIDDDFESKDESVSGCEDSSSWDHTFSDYGEFVVKAIVYDDRNSKDHYGFTTWNVEVGYDPTATRKSPSDQSVELIEGQEQEFTVDVEDKDSDLFYVEWYLDDSFIEKDTDVSGETGTSSWTNDFPDKGDFEVKAIVYDDRNLGDHVGSTTWDVTVKEAVDPEATRESPTDQDIQITKGSEQTFETALKDDNCDLYYVEWYIDDEFKSKDESVSGCEDNSSWDHTFPDYGSFVVKAIGYDDRNSEDHYGFTTWNVEVGYDPTATRKSPSDQSVELTEGQTQEFTVNVEDKDSDLFYVEWYLDDTFIEKDTDVSGETGTSSWTNDFPDKGDFEVKAIVYDDRNSEDHYGFKTWDVMVYQENAIPETPTPLEPTDEDRISTLSPILKWSSFENGGDRDTQAGYQVRVRCDDCSEYLFFQNTDWGHLPNDLTYELVDETPPLFRITDIEGEMCLQIKNRANEPDRAKVRTKKEYGAGIYEWKVFVPEVNERDTATSIGAFLYSPQSQPDKDYHDREMDFEIGFGKTTERIDYKIKDEEIMLYMVLSRDDSSGTEKSVHAVGVDPGFWYVLRLHLTMDDSNNYVVTWSYKKDGWSNFITPNEREGIKCKYGNDASDYPTTFYIYSSLEYLPDFIGDNLPTQDRMTYFEYFTYNDKIVYDTGFIADAANSSHNYSSGSYSGIDPVTGILKVSDSLDWGKQYHWHVRYRDSYGDWSKWSTDDPGRHQNFSTINPSGRISYNAPDKSHVDVGTLTITSTFDVDLENSPNITIDMPDPMETIGPQVMIGSGKVWEYDIEIQEHNDDSTATDGVSSVTLSGINYVPEFPGDDIIDNFITDTIDTDGDGERNYEDDDDDDDDMPDHYENEYSFLDPLDKTDADQDFDGDGITNVNEYFIGSLPDNRSPDKPVCNEPADMSKDISLAPLLATYPYSDFENDAHNSSRFQICSKGTFTEADLVYDIETTDYLENYPVPEMLLAIGTKYFWRVQFLDVKGGKSKWSDTYSFTTIDENDEDKDSNGIPDLQDVEDDAVDINNDGVRDVFSDSYKAVKTVEGNHYISIKALANVDSVATIKSIPLSEITDADFKPESMPMGLVQFKIAVSNAGDEAIVDVFLSEDALVGSSWYKYSIANGWQDYSENATFINQRHVRLTLIDGGVGDADGVQNSIIFDPSGVGMGSAAPSAVAASGSGGGGGVCFIATAAFGSPINKHVAILKRFRDQRLLQYQLGKKFVSAYYKYSPSLAGYLREHEIIRMVVRWALLPVIGLSWVALYVQPLILVSILLLIFAIFGFRFNRKRVRDETFKMQRLV